MWSRGAWRLALNDPLIKAGPPLSGLIVCWGSGVTYRAAGGQSSCSMLIAPQYTHHNADRSTLQCEPSLVTFIMTTAVCQFL